MEHLMVHHPKSITRESGRWSHASSVILGTTRLIFIAGQTARQPDSAPLPGDDLDEQVRLVYANLGAVLADAGASFDSIVSMRTFLTKRENIGAFAQLRDVLHDSLFTNQKFPPNTLVVVSGLADPRMLVEIEAIAVVTI